MTDRTGPVRGKAASEDGARNPARAARSDRAGRAGRSAGPGEPSRTTRTPSTTERGRCGEERALAYLLSQGLSLIERNARGRRGEIDLVMRDGATLVFVEVRLRRSAAFGGAAASIGADKQARMWRAAEHYLLRHPGRHHAAACRFDAVCIDGDSLHWLRHVLVR